MRLSIEPNMSGLSEIIAEHNGESITYRGNTYNRIKVDVEHFFDDINGYWEELPFGQQNAIWAIYKKIDLVFNSVQSGKQTFQQLQTLVKELYDQHPMEKLDYWIRMKSKVKYPELLTEYSPDLPKEMTYLRSDYTGLLALTLGLRVFLPIMSKYMAMAEREAGKPFKEFITIKLLDRSAIAESEPMKRLAVYVRHSAQIDPNKPSLSALLGGLGTSELPDYLLASALARRVAISEMRTTGDVNIVANVWHYVVSSSRDIDKRFGGSTKNKDGNDSGGEDDKQSVAESYKIKQDVSEATTIPDSVFLQNYIDVARQIDDTINPDLLEKMWNHQRIITTYNPTEFQMNLAGWVLAPIVSFRSIRYLEFPALMRAVSISQYLLWHWGYPDLAALMTATPAKSVSGEDESLMGRAWRSATPDMLALLDAQYPHWKRSNRKGTRTPESNMALVAIRKMFQEITSSDWALKAPKELVAQLSMVEYDNGYEAPLDLEFQLVDFVTKNNIRKTNKVGV